MSTMSPENCYFEVKSSNEAQKALIAGVMCHSALVSAGFF